MRHHWLATLSLCALPLLASPAHAKGHHRYRHHHRHYIHIARADYSASHRFGDARPRAWCGWYMRQLLGVRDTAYNLARNWSHYGSATSAHVGAIVVWPHHVGKIVGGSPGHWAVLSGNYGGRVRTAMMSTSGAIAFRE